MKINEITQASLLYDFYGQLLSKRQREVMELYHEENLSLSEIADEFGISRQGVHDALKNAERSLSEYEAKLGLVAKFQKSSHAVEQIDEIIDTLIASLQVYKSKADGKERPQTNQVIKNLNKVKEIIDNLEE